MPSPCAACHLFQPSRATENFGGDPLSITSTQRPNPFHNSCDNLAAVYIKDGVKYVNYDASFSVVI